MSPGRPRHLPSDEMIRDEFVRRVQAPLRREAGCHPAADLRRQQKHDQVKERKAHAFDSIGKRLAIANELRTEGLLVACLVDGEASGVLRTVDPVMTASLVKPLPQDAGLVPEALEISATGGYA